MSLTESISASNKMEYNPDNKMSIVGPEERLKRGIWPQSISLWMVAFYIALFIIRPWEKLLPWLGSFHFERIYASCMIIVVFLTWRDRFRMSFQTVTIGFFFVGVVLSALFAINPSLSWNPLYEYTTLIIIYFILLLVIRTPYELVFMVTCYIVAMAVYLAKSQWEFFMYGANRYTQGVTRLVGIENTLSGPNSLAMSIVVSLPMLLFLWSNRKEFSSGWPSFWRRWYPRFLAFYAVLAVSSMIMTNSRSGMVSFILFVVLVTLRGRGIGRKLGYIFLGALILTMLWFVLPEEKKNRFMTIYNPEAGPEIAQRSAMGRIEGYKAGMTMFERFPFTGVGIGNFNEYRFEHVDGIRLEAHNLVGQLLGETGIVGGVAFILMVIVTLLNCRKVRVPGRGQSNATIKALSSLGPACRDAVILLAFEGLFGHNLLRFNWLWLAAFSSLALQFARKHIKEPISTKGL